MCVAVSIVAGHESVSAEATVEDSISVTQPFGVAVDEARSRLYVTNPAENQIRVYDSNNLSFLGSRTIASFPTTVEVNEATGNVYVAHQGSGDRISVLDSSLNLLTELPLANPWGPAVNTVTNRFYVANTFGGDVWVVDGATNSVLQTIALPGNSTLGVAVDETKNRVLATDRYSNELYVIDGTTNSVSDTVPTGNYPAWVAVDEPLDRIYVSNQNDGTVSVFDGTSFELVDLIEFAAGSRPDKIAVNDVTHRAYISLQGADGSTTPPTPPRVAIIDTKTNTVVDEVPVPSGTPYQLDVDDSTSRVFVPTYSGGTVTVIADPVPIDSDGDGITDDVDSDPSTPSSGFADANGTAGEILANGTGAPVTVIDLLDPEGVRIVTGGSTGQVTVKACGFFTLQVAAGSEIDLACGSIVITVGPGGPLIIEVDGEKDLSIEIPSGVSARISTPVNDDFTIEYLSGSQPIIVREPSDPWDFEYPNPRETWVFSGTQSFTTNLPPTVDSVALSTANAVIGEQVELTATFSDPGIDDTHTCEVTWASGVSVPGTVAAGQCTSSYTYSGLGLNSVIVRVTDDAGDVGSSGASVLVFDPDTYWTYDPTTTFDVNGIGIDVDPVTQDVWIVENNKNKVAKYTADGTLLFEVGGFGTAPGLFNGPSVVAVHPSTGDAYITDVGGNRVQQFDRNGNFVRAFGAGSGTAFDNPLGIDVDAAGNVWVADVFNGKVQKFSSSGAYLGTLGGTGTAPYAVTVDPDGFVWVSDFEGSRDKVHKINPATGQRVLTLTGFGQPVDITFDDVGQAHIVNSNTKEIRTYTVAGIFVASRPMPVVQSNGRYSQPYPYRLAINGDGRLLLTNGSSQVAVFDPPVPPDTDGDGIPDSIECDPEVDGGFCDPDGGGHTGTVLSNGTGEPVTFVDLPAPEGVKVIVGGTTGQVRLAACTGGFKLTAPAGSEFDLTCGSIELTVYEGPVEVLVEGERDQLVTIPAGTTVAISTPVDGEFTVEVTAGTSFVEVSDPDDPYGYYSTYVYAGLGPVTISTTAPPTVESTSFSAINVSLGDEVAVTVTFTDDAAATHTCEVTWAPGVSQAGVVDATTCTASYTYTTVGLKSVSVRVIDGDGGVGYGGGSVLVTEAEHYWTLDASASFALDGADGSSGVDIDPNTGDIWVIHSQLNTIAKYSPDGTKRFEVGGFGARDGQFNGASNIAVGPNGDAYITDVGGNRVQVFDQDGNFVRTFGGGPTPFDNPTSVDVDADGNVWVSDVFGDFVRKYTPTGTFLDDLGTVVEPSASRVDPEGYIWVTETRDRVHKIDPDTKARVVTITGFGQPLDVTFDEENVHVVDSDSKEIRTYTRADGTFVDSRPTPVVLSSSGGSFQPYPRRAAVDAAGRLVLANGSPTLMVFDPPAPADTDGDGIPDSIECDPEVDGGFCDPDGGGHTGTVLSNGTDGEVSFVDLPAPEGVKVIVGGTTGQARIRLCGGFVLGMSAGNEVNVTCGSITIEVIAGGAVTLTPEGGDGVTTVTVPQGVTVYVNNVAGDQFSVEYRAGDAPVVVEVNGVITNVDLTTPDLDFSANVAPVIDAVAAPTAPVSLAQQPVAVSVAFTDPGTSDSHTCAVSWGDGETTTGAVDGLACSRSHTYAQAGVYTVEVTVTDDAGDSNTATSLVVVYDPAGGFVTGGGWIDSPLGAYVPDPDAAGPARFGFVSQYKKGATVPTGSTQFQFQAGDVNLHSNQFEWLVVSGARAQFRGTGSVNGVDGYRFTVTVIDGDVISKGQFDRFRMRIWEPSGGLVYDNQIGAADSDDPTTAITQGSIVIHTKGNK